MNNIIHFVIFHCVSIPPRIPERMVYLPLDVVIAESEGVEVSMN